MNNCMRAHVCEEQRENAVTLLCAADEMVGGSRGTEHSPLHCDKRHMALCWSLGTAERGQATAVCWNLEKKCTKKTFGQRVKVIEIY